MIEIMLLALTVQQPAIGSNAFNVDAELQGMYEEISQATLQFVTESDVDLFHDVLYTPDWVFVDAAGQKHTWPQMRERAIQALSEPALRSMNQSIQKLSLAPDGATVLVNVTTVRAVVDAEGKYGRQGASHTLTETTAFRDRWVKASGSWKLTSREQLGQPTVAVDKPELST